MSDTVVFVPYDLGMAPTTARAGVPLASPQSGLVLYGSDYKSPANGQIPKVDANGYLYTVPATAVSGGTTFASAAAVTGNVMLALNALTATPTQIDNLGNLQAAPAVQPTFVAVAAGASLATGKSLIALLNKSTSSVVRLVAAYAQNTATNPGVLSTYNIFAEQLHLITGATGGSSITPLAHDTADALASGITCSTGATVSGETSTPFKRWITSNYPIATGGTAAEYTTFDQQGRDPWVGRLDLNAKPITIRPGYGVHIKVATTVSFGAQDVCLVFTVSAA